jgi:hypothetical protein
VTIKIWLIIRIKLRLKKPRLLNKKFTRILVVYDLLVIVID